MTIKRRIGGWTLKPAARATLLATSALAITAVVAPAPAAKLDEQTCAQLKLEVTQLEGMGVRDNFAKGAAWGKSNLARAQLEQVKKLIEMDEAIAFRCARPKPPPPVPDPDAAATPPIKGKAAGKAVAKVKPAEQTARPRPKTPATGQQSSDGAPRPAQPRQAQGQKQGETQGQSPPAQTTERPPPPKPRPKPAPSPQRAPEQLPQ